MQPNLGVRGWYGRDAPSRRRSRAYELAVLHPHGGPPDGRAAKTLYDLLGASPVDDAEGLKDAFRKAVKASHPDLHPNDSDATVRLSGIVRAYAILRDPHERASYDQALAFNCEPPYPETKRTFFNTTRHIFTEAGAVALLTVVLGGGYVFVASVLSQFSKRGEVAEVHGSPKIAAVEPAVSGPPRATIEGKEQDDKLTGVAGVVATNAMIAPGAAAPPTNHDALEVAHDVLEVANAKPLEAATVKPVDAGNAKPLPGAPEQPAAAAIGGMTDQINVKITSDQSNISHEVDPPDRNQESSSTPGGAAPARVKLSSLGRGNDISKPPSSDLAASEQKRRPETTDAKSVDVKTPKLTAHEKLRAAEMRPPAEHTQAKQATLDNKSTSACSESQSCSGKSPPLLGVGF